MSIYAPIVWDADPAKRPTIDHFRYNLDHFIGLVDIEHIGLGADQHQSIERDA